MKKIFLSVVLFLLFPSFVFASSVEVTDYLVDATILNNGDLEVKELILAKGSFNWYERDLLYQNTKLAEGSSFSNNNIYNASDITDIEIKAGRVSKIDFDSFNADFDDFKLVSNAYNGDKGKYTETKLSGGYRYRIYYATESSKTAFYIKYTVKNVVVLHNDVAELYWTFVPDGFEETLRNVKVKVHLPGNDNSKNFKIWAHGNLSGEIEKENNSTIYANINEVMSGETVDVRTTFDKSLITNTYNVKKSNVDALEDIIRVEEDRAEVANNLRQQLLRKYNIVKYSSIGLFILTIGLFVFVYFKYGRSPKSGYYSKYNREFIDDYNVEVIDYLMNRNITPNAMSASIMNLIYKKNIKVLELDNGKSNKKDYEFILENRDNLNESENILVDFLFLKVGKKETNENDKMTFTTKDLKKYASGTKTCTTFINSYTKWKNNVLKVGKEENFFIKPTKPVIFGVIVLILAIIVFTLNLSWQVVNILSIIDFILGVFFFLYTILMYRKTPKGAEHYDKWKAFKNFLKDFGAFDLKELPEIVLWERYLVYATIFGLADKVQKSMNVRIKELDITGIDYYPSYFYINLGSTINTSVNNALSSAYSAQAANYSNSHSSFSSGSGFGGGFSSGGGFGGGGGGGRFG